MSKYIYQDLLDRQTKVTRITGYTIVGFFSIIYLVLGFRFGFDNRLLSIMGIFILVNLVNIIASSFHNKIYITYQLLIILTFLFMLGLAYFTGGLKSPVIFILSVLPVAAYSTSRKQGVLWSFVSGLTIFLFLGVHYYDAIPVSIISDDYLLTFSVVSLLFLVSLAIIMSYMINKSSFAAHRKSDREAKELRVKTLRLENLTTLLNYSNDLMCIIDQESLVIDDLNPVFKLHLGYELSEVRGSAFSKFIKQNESTKSLLKNLKSMKDDQVYEFPCIMLGKNGNEIVFNWVAIAKNGKVHASANMNPKDKI